MPSNWEVLLHDAFVEELEQLNENLQDELLAHAKLLANYGPHLGRPTVDTLALILMQSPSQIYRYF